MAIIAELFDNYESGREEITRQGKTATRVLLSDNYTGWEADAPEIGDEHPVDDDLIVARITMQGWGKPVGALNAPDYEYAKITVTYNSAGMETEGESLLSGSMAVELLEIGPGRTWSDGTTPVDVPINATYSVHRLRIEKAYLTLPIANINACMNTVNNANWTPSGYPAAIAAGCALMLAPEWRQELVRMTGQRVLVSYEFMIRNIGWNYAWNAADGDWDTTLPVLYGSSNFGTLGLST